MQQLKHEAIIQALDWHNWNRTRTADALGVSLRGLRNTINEMREAGIEIKPSPKAVFGPVCWLKNRPSKYGY